MQKKINRRKLLKLTAVTPITGIALNTLAPNAIAEPSLPVPLLPQEDPEPWTRQAATISSKNWYTWTENIPFLPGVPGANLLPPEEVPTIEWLLEGADGLITLALSVLASVMPQFNAAHTGALLDDEKQLLAIQQRTQGYRHRFTELGNGKYNQIGARNSPRRIEVAPEDAAQATIIQTELMELFNQLVTLIGNLGTNIELLMASEQASGDFTSEDGLTKYNVMWQTTPVPEAAGNIHDDEFFAYLRVGGWDTTAIERVRDSLPEKFPLTEEQYREGIQANDSLEKAIRENRLFICDYAEIAKLAPEGKTTKLLTGDGYCSAAIAVFAIPPGGTRLVPVAIQCGQDPATSTMFVRPHAGDNDRYWGWQMAKTVVQTADFVRHEFMTHLARTHLVSEVFSVALPRNLAPNHPLRILLAPHNEGDIFVNILAATLIMPPNLFADVIFAAPIGDIAATALEARLAWDFYERMPRNDFKRRGVEDPKILKEYPYRDDSLLIWDSIHEWVNDYIRTYYSSDAVVLADTELAAWVDEIASLGKIKGFREITSVEQLVEVVTMIIFTSSAFHASVNFPQGHLLSYAPLASGLTVTPPPIKINGYTEADWIAMLPGTVSSVAQFFFLNLLASVYYRPLGEYRSNFFPYYPIFTDPRIAGAQGPLEKFKDRLHSAEDTIKNRNKSRYQPYEYLLPSNIPTSTNI
ncbi:MAG: lipoxygenase family protein [Mycobacteriaceae bacterium]